MSNSTDNMIADLTERDFIVFAGAGMSKVTGVRGWRELLEALNGLVALEGVDIAKIDSLHFPEIAQMIYDRLERDGRIGEYYETIQECMKPTQSSWESRHWKIIRASNSVVTTNIDGVFEEAMTDILADRPHQGSNGQERFPEINTACGLSNVSFGLPQRAKLNRYFLTMAMAAGLDCAIVDTMDCELMDAVKASEALLGKDRFCKNYIKAFRESKRP